ncbi:hypothetical protein F5Y17DRAFT_417276 [Xylariaceae sp. FL0594]|nr:hypothetical protein F5Y17DRAFT_417276 [Xylariaceae sp. FL0594]
MDIEANWVESVPSSSITSSQISPRFRLTSNGRVKITLIGTGMLSITYTVALLGVLILLIHDPLTRYLTSGLEPRPLPHTARPPVNESLVAADDDGTAWSGLENCVQDAYSVHIVSRAPLVVYIENFLSVEEREHLLEISEPLFEPSTITNDGQKTQRDTSVRDSEVALIPRTDVVRCIEARARAFQGWREDLWLERLRTQRYGPDQHYSHHFDWGNGARGWGRASSFMVWVAASEDLEGGGTEFPRLERSAVPDGRLCRFIECGDQPHPRQDHPEEAGDARPGKEGKNNSKKNKSKSKMDGGNKRNGLGVKKEGEDKGKIKKTNSGLPARVKGVTFKAIPGNAVYWENFRPDGTGRGWQETWHAGLPVTKGTKVGLNIWSSGRLT